MNATDLMIGDWVDRFGKPPYYKVLAINSCTTEVTIAQSEEDEETMRICWEDKLDPISLTPEILENNGFVELRDKCCKWEYAKDIYINADFTEKEPWTHINNGYYSAIPVCRYVHELQHALKLCGINKEIVL